MSKMKTFSFFEKEYKQGGIVMGRYILKRLGVALVTFFGITLLAYALTSMMPGSPIDFIVSSNPNMTADQVAAMEEEMGLNQPVVIQYIKWLMEFLKGNLGYSYRTGNPVFEEIMVKLGGTLLLVGASMVLSLIIAIPLGTIAALKPNSTFDYISSGLAFVGNSTPGFFAGMIFIYFFCVKSNFFPMGGMYTSPSNKTVGDLIYHLVLPCSALALQQIGGYMRHVRSNMLETLGEDYIRTSKAKGLGRTRVVIAHGLRNAMIPIVTIVGMNIPLLIGGSVVTETVFSWPGIGMLMTTSINARDYPIIMGVTVVVATAVLVGNILIDFIYCIVDPRIKYS